MTPKDKAFELITKFQHPITDMSDTDCLHIEVAKEFAIIAVDEMIIQNGELYLNGLDGIYYREKNSYLFEVKQEIEAL